MFSPLIQYLVSQGLTIVAPNVRGSTGYGRRGGDLVYLVNGGNLP